MATSSIEARAAGYIEGLQECLKDAEEEMAKLRTTAHDAVVEASKTARELEEEKKARAAAEAAAAAAGETANAAEFELKLALAEKTMEFLRNKLARTQSTMDAYIEKYKGETSQHFRYNVLKTHVNALRIKTAEDVDKYKKKVRAEATALMEEWEPQHQGIVDARARQEAALDADLEAELDNIRKAFADKKKKNGSASSARPVAAPAGIAKPKSKASRGPTAAAAKKAAAEKAAAEEEEGEEAAAPAAAAAKGAQSKKRPASALGGDAPPPAAKRAAVRKPSGRMYFQKMKAGEHKAEKAKQPKAKQSSFVQLPRWAGEKWDALSKEEQEDWQARAEAAEAAAEEAVNAAAEQAEAEMAAAERAEAEGEEEGEEEAAAGDAAQVTMAESDDEEQAAAPAAAPAPAPASDDDEEEEEAGKRSPSD